MRSLLRLCFLTKALSVSCPWPLVYTTHKNVLTYHNISIPCQLGCGVEPKVSILFTPEEQNEIDNIIIVLCFFALGISIIYSFNLVLQHMDHPRSFHKADLAYQIPFIINICYITMICLIVFSPGGHLNKQYPAYCNSDEHTLSSGDPANGNTSCTLIAAVVFIGIKMISAYTMALALVLFITFWFPFYRNRQFKCLVHGYIALTIAVKLAVAFGLSSVKGNLHMRMCLATIQNPAVTLWLEIVPNTTYQVFCTILLLLCVYKLYRMNTEKVSKTEQRDGKELEKAVRKSSSGKRFSTSISLKNMIALPPKRAWKESSRTAQLRSLAYRLLIFTIIQSIFVFLLIFIWVYWYNNVDNWEDIARDVILCQVQQYGGFILRGGTDPDRTMLESAYDCVNSLHTGKNRPPPWSHWLFYLSCAGSAIGGLVLTCSSQNLKKWIYAKQWIYSQVTSVVETKTLERSSTQSSSIPIPPGNAVCLEEPFKKNDDSTYKTTSFKAPVTLQPPEGGEASDITDITIPSGESEDELFEVETISPAKRFSNDRQTPSSKEIQVEVELIGKNKLYEKTRIDDIAALHSGNEGSPG